jgi:hypothetical protein
MKEVLPWLVRWACRASTRDFHSALAFLVGPVQNSFTLFKFLCPHSSASWAGSRAGSPISQYVSLITPHSGFYDLLILQMCAAIGLPFFFVHKNFMKVAL